MRGLRLSGLVLGLLFILNAPVYAARHYVNAGASGNNDGGSWENAFVDFQSALAAALSGDEVWVAAGTYYPGSTRDSTFQLLNGVAVYGGFAGTEAALEARDPAAHATILSGDIGVPDDASDNCYHVFYHPSGTGLDSTAVLDGFTIADGNADGGYPHNHGGGMYNENSAPSLTNCVFRNNAAAGNGGSLYNSDAAPVLVNCRFSGNTAAKGGAMYNTFSAPVAANCLFSGNSAASGGGMENVASSPQLTGCTFTANRASESGGAMANSYNSSQPKINSCILWGNTAQISGHQIHNTSSSVPLISHSSIENCGGSGGAWDTALGSDDGGNTAADPHFFRNPGPGNDSTWGTSDDDLGDLHLTAGSPCIETGDPSIAAGFDMDGWSRPVDGDCDGAAIVDMGADEWVDADCDGLSDYEETAHGTDPSLSDTDGDGLSDGAEANIHGTDPLDADMDDDGLMDGAEILTHATDPGNPDTDGDGYTDHIEVYHAADPLSADDTPGPVTIHVDDNAGGLNSGRNWTDAFTDLQTALALASAGDQIWVAAGTYFPGNTRTSAFQLLNGVAVYGGFAGTEAALEARDPAANPTILSGAIGAEDDTSDNCYHVFYHPGGTALDSTAILDGVTITGGNAAGTYTHQYGGGMYNAGASPTLVDCIFSNNAGIDGGGLYNTDAAPSLENCIFQNNAATGDGGGMYNSNAAPVLATCSFMDNTAAGGGALYNYFASPIIEGCTFNGNQAANGGGLVNDASSPVLTGCTFAGNMATASGGALANYYNSTVPVVVACIFTANTAGADGGAIANDDASPAIVNCTFSANSADRGGALANLSFSSPVLTSCILFQDAAQSQGNEIFNNDTSVTLIRYSNIGNSGGSTAAWDTAIGSDGGGNIDADPLFVENPAGGSAGDVHLSPGSPCIDAGDPEASGQSDCDGQARVVDGNGDGTAIVDMGADEWMENTDTGTVGSGGGGGGCFISSVLF